MNALARFTTYTLLAGLVLSTPLSSFARDVDYDKGEVVVRVTPGEPTQLSFPGAIAGGFRKKISSLSLEPKNSDLVIFANEAIGDSGEGIIVRLKDGRSYSVRVAKASAERPRDTMVTINDSRGSILGEEEDAPPSRERQFEYAPPSQVSGLMREIVLAAEFGKASIPGYRATEAYKGQTVLNDGAIVATIDKIFIGSNLWGYVLDAQNNLSQTQKLNPAAFRLDGTRAVSLSNWELAATPMTAEQQIAGKHKAKVYIVTKARK